MTQKVKEFIDEVAALPYTWRLRSSGNIRDIKDNRCPIEAMLLHKGFKLSNMYDDEGLSKLNLEKKDVIPLLQAADNSTVKTSFKVREYMLKVLQPEQYKKA